MKRKFVALIVCVFVVLSVFVPVTALASYATDLKFTDENLQKGNVDIYEINDGEWFSFFATAENNDSENFNITYQWYKDGELLEGYEDSYLAIYPVSIADKGVYTCKVTDGILTITTKSLSPFAVVVNEDQAAAGDIPKTGDDTNIVMFVIMICISLSVITVIIRKRFNKA